jgi:putative transposase
LRDNPQHAIPRSATDEAEQLEIAQFKHAITKLKAGRYILKSRGLLRERTDVKFSFHREAPGDLLADWMCKPFGIPRGGFYVWLTRPRRSTAAVMKSLVRRFRASFVGSDRTYGPRRVWRDITLDGVSCGLHRIERLMRLEALKERPRRRRQQPGCR